MQHHTPTPTPRPETARRWWRQPWLHFLVIGGALFALDQPEAAPNSDDIVIRAQHIEELRAARKHGGEAVTEADMQAEIDRYIESEIMVREARRLARSGGQERHGVHRLLDRHGDAGGARGLRGEWQA